MPSGNDGISTGVIRVGSVGTRRLDC